MIKEKVFTQHLLATLVTLELFFSGCIGSPTPLCLSHLVCFRSTNSRVVARFSDVFSMFLRKVHSPDLPASGSRNSPVQKRSVSSCHRPL